MAKQFTRKKEDFICEHCGFKVKGNGYTNHCPKCLWGKHVDVNPGDRAETCQGLMEPVGIERRGDELSVLQRCTQCRVEKKNKIGKEDNLDVVIGLFSH